MTQVLYNPKTDDLQKLLDEQIKANPFDVLLSAIQVTPNEIVLRFGSQLLGWVQTQPTIWPTTIPSVWGGAVR